MPAKMQTQSKSQIYAVNGRPADWARIIRLALASGYTPVDGLTRTDEAVAWLRKCGAKVEVGT